MLTFNNSATTSLFSILDATLASPLGVRKKEKAVYRYSGPVQQNKKVSHELKKIKSEILDYCYFYYYQLGLVPTFTFINE